MFPNIKNIRLLGIFLIVYLFTFNSHATTNIDSLLQSFQDKNTPITDQLETIKKEVKRNYKVNVNNTFLLLDKGIELAKNAKRDTAHADLYYLKGRIQKRLGEKASANTAYLKAKQLYTTINDNEGISKVINELGWLEINKGAYQEARTLFLEALSFAEKTGKPLQKAIHLNDIGVTYYYQKVYDKAADYYLQATRLREAENNEAGLSISYNNLGLIYSKSKDYENAIKYYEKGLKIATAREDLRRIASLNINLGNLKAKNKELENALRYYEEGLKAAIKYKNPSKIALCKFNIGRIYTELANYPSALIHLESSLKTYEELKEHQNKATALFELGKVHYLMKRAKKGIPLMEKGIRLEQKTNAISIPYYKYLAKIYQQENEPIKAYDFLLRYQVLKDSLESITIKENIAGLQIQFEEEFKAKEQEQEITLLNQAQKFQSNRFKLISFFLGLLFFLAVALIWHLFQKVKINKLLNSQNEELNTQKEALIALNEEKERAIIKAVEAAKAKEEFMASMSHEIRTPMNAVVGITNLLIDEAPREDQIENLETLKFSSKNLLGIINDILDFSKIETGNIIFEKIDFSLAALLKNIIETFNITSTNKGIELRLEGQASQLKRQLIGDPTRMTQIFTNLLGNAIKFTSEGHVSLCAKIMEANESSATIYFEVRDTGIGIPENKLESIFESFTQAAEDTTRLFGGTGLGLTITKNLIELQGGKIQVKSQKGEGSTFYFTLTFPLGKIISTNNKKKLVGSLSSKIGLEGCSILLAEDNKINQLVAKKILKKWKVKLDIANDGVEVLEMVAQKEYDLILMDIQMPRMNGFEATKKIRSLNSAKKDMPIIALTASAIHVVSNDTENKYGFDAYVCKPFSPDHLFDKIMECLVPTTLTL